MRFEIHQTPQGYECIDPDHPDGPEILGTGRSPDEALGEAVHNAWLASNSDDIVVDDISESAEDCNYED